MVIALIMVAVLASLGAATFIYINNRYKVVHDAASWQEALHSAEAGVEVALTEIRRPLSGLDTFTLARGWDTVNGVRTFDSNQVILRKGEGGTESWTKIQVDVPFVDSTGEEWFRVRSHGYCRIAGGARSAGNREDIRLRKLSLNADRYSGSIKPEEDMFKVASSEGPVAHRAVEAIIRPMSAFQMALFGKNRIDMTNHNIVVDSYDSRDQSKSYWAPGATYGTYPWINGQESQGVDESKRQWNGDIGTNGEIINAGGAHIYGTANTNEGTVEDADNITGHFENDPDRIRNDFSMDLAEVIAPTIQEEPTSTSYASMTAIQQDTEIQAGDGVTTVVRVSTINLSGQKKLTIKGLPDKTTDAHIIVSGDISLSGQAQIILEKGVRLRIFVEGDADIAGNGVANPNAPVNFQLYGTTRNADDSENTGHIKISGNGGFSGAVYAPNHDLEILGGGNGDNVFGGFVANTVRMNGVQSVHYDEALGDGGIVAGYKIVSWFEDER